MSTLMEIRTKAGGPQVNLEIENRLLLKSRFRYLNERDSARKENAYEM